MRRNPIPPAATKRFKPRKGRPPSPLNILVTHLNDEPHRLLYGLACLHLSIDPFIARYKPQSPLSMLSAREERHSHFLETVGNAMRAIAMQDAPPEYGEPFWNYAGTHSWGLVGPRIKSATSLALLGKALFMSPWRSLEAARIRRYATSVVNNSVLRLSRAFGPSDGPRITALLLREWIEEPPSSLVSNREWHLRWLAFWDEKLGPKQLGLPGMGPKSFVR